MNEIFPLLLGLIFAMIGGGYLKRALDMKKFLSGSREIKGFVDKTDRETGMRGAKTVNIKYSEDGAEKNIESSLDMGWMHAEKYEDDVTLHEKDGEVRYYPEKQRKILYLMTVLFFFFALFFIAQFFFLQRQAY
ncbi:hypothetical protein Dip518_001255 [Parelusimicrobium proximum]|uniref:hypothetical protein n=1 Tax=Parelusimicrobium proximum TaxID=3228953 RepID=UPI003D17C6CF